MLMSSIRNIKQYSADSAYSTTTAVSFYFVLLLLLNGELFNFNFMIYSTLFLFTKITYFQRKSKWLFDLSNLYEDRKLQCNRVLPFHINRVKKRVLLERIKNYLRRNEKRS